MNRLAVTLPDLGFDQAAKVLTWFVKSGTLVAAGDPLLEVLVEGAAIVVPSPQAGVVHRVAGDERLVSVGDLLCYLDDGAGE